MPSRAVELLRQAAAMVREAEEVTLCTVCRHEIRVVRKAVEQLAEIIEIAELYAEKMLSAKELNEVKQMITNERFVLFLKSLNRTARKLREQGYLVSID